VNNGSLYQFKGVLKVGQVHTGPGDLPSVVAQISTNQLPENWVKKQQTLEKNADGNDPKIRQDFMQEVYKDRKMLETIKLST